MAAVVEAGTSAQKVDEGSTMVDALVGSCTVNGLDDNSCIARENLGAESEHSRTDMGHSGNHIWWTRELGRDYGSSLGQCFGVLVLHRSVFHEAEHCLGIDFVEMGELHNVDRTVLTEVRMEVLMVVVVVVGCLVSVYLSSANALEMVVSVSAYHSVDMSLAGNSFAGHDLVQGPGHARNQSVPA